MEEGRKVLLILRLRCVTLITRVRARGTFHKVMKWLKCGFLDMNKCVQGIARNGGRRGIGLLLPPLNCIVSIAVQVVKFGKCLIFWRDNY